MKYVLDIIVVCILLLCIITSVRKGFMRSLLELLSLIIAFFVAKTYSPQVSEYISQNIVSKMVGEFLNKAAASNSSLVSAINSLGDIFKSINDAKALKDLTGFKLELATQSISADKILSNLTSSISLSISSIIAFVALFILTIIAMKIVIAILDAIFKLPVVGAINKILGFMFGFVQGAVFVYILCLALSFVIMASVSSKTPILTTDTISQTYVLKYFYNNNLFSGFLF